MRGKPHKLGTIFPLYGVGVGDAPCSFFYQPLADEAAAAEVDAIIAVITATCWAMSKLVTTEDAVVFAKTLLLISETA